MADWGFWWLDLRHSSLVTILPRITNFQKKRVSNGVVAVRPSIGHDKDGGPF
jgi:hypothetical protein